MESSSFINAFMEVGLYSLWLIPVFGVYAYFRIFIDRYTIALKNTQHSFNVRMIEESDLRRTRANMGQMAKDHNLGEDEKEEAIVDLRSMSPDDRIVYCLDKGLILSLPVPNNLAKVGQVTGADTFNANGELLLSRGSYLTKDSIAQLQRLSIENVLVMFHPDNPLVKKLLG